MTDGISSERKKDLCKLLASNLPTLRAKANLSQEDLADRLGFSRQTVSAIENKNREMQWSTFSAIILFFVKNQELYQIMSIMNLLGDDVKELFYPSTN